MATRKQAAASNKMNRKRKKAEKMAAKRSLMQHVQSLPPELEQQIDNSVDNLMEQVQGESTATPVTSSGIKPAATTVKVEIEQDQIKDEDKKRDSELKVDKNLLKAVEKLTKSMDFANKKAEDEKKKGLKGFLGSKIAAVKNAFTLEGAAGMLGVRRDDGSLKGAILGSMLQRQEKKAEKAKFIADFGQFTEKGRSLKGEELVAEGGKRFEALKKVQSEKEHLETKAAQAKAFGGELSKKEQQRLRVLEKTEKVILDKRGKVPVPPKGALTQTKTKREELLAGAAEGMAAQIAESTPEERASLREMDPQTLRDAFKSSLEELVKISDEQLAQLERLAKNSEPSEEDKLEGRKAESMAPVMERREKTKEIQSGEEGSGSIMSSMFDMLKNRIPGVGTAARIGGKILRGGAKAISSVGRFAARGLGKALPILGAGAAKVAGAGSKLLPAIASGASKGIGALSTVASAAPGVAKAGLGAAKGILGKLGPIAMLGMAAYDGISGYNSAGENLGIEGREATTGEKLSSAAGSILSGLSFGLLDEKSMSKGIASLTGAGPEKLPDVQRVQQAQELAAKKLAGDMESASKNAAPVVNNSPTTIINNNNSKASETRFNIRNNDASYNDRLTRHFAFQ